MPILNLNPAGGFFPTKKPARTPQAKNKQVFFEKKF